MERSLHKRLRQDLQTQRATSQQLQAALSQAHEQIATLNDSLHSANAKRHVAEQRLIKTRASLTYQLGYQLKAGTRSLGALLRLPVILLRLYRQARRNRLARLPIIAERVGQSLPFTAPVITTPPPHPLAEADYIRSHLLPGAQDNALPLKVAGVMDTFTYDAYRHECQLLQLTPAHWLAELEAFQPQLLFIESAWRGKDDLWRNKVAHNSEELRGIVQWCRDRDIPTVFWNKEDPVHYETFLNTAKPFDVVFTTDIDCIHRYKGALGHARVYLLPFACQPAVHNPIELYERKDGFCFAGSYYVRYTARTHDLENILSALPGYAPLEIFDRNLGHPHPNHQFPNEYQPYIVGSLSAEQMPLAYKGYRYGINLNSVKQSQSMFARRVFELLGSNTLTVSNFSRGLRLLLGDLVITTDNGAHMRSRLKTLADTPQGSAKLRLAGLRKVMQEHTYAHRLRYVMAKVTGTPQDDPLPTICIIANAVNLAELLALTHHLQRQRYPNIIMNVVVNSEATATDPRLRLINRRQLNATTVAELANGAGWVAGMVAEDYYGPHYLLDLALATRYSQANVLGKVAHYAVDEHGIHLFNAGQDYRRADAIAARCALIKTTLLARQTAHDWLDSLPTLEYRDPKALATDAFSYCRQAAGLPPQQVSAAVNDPGMDSGIALDTLLRQAETIPAQVINASAPHIGARALAKLFTPLGNRQLRDQLDADVDAWHISSSLADGKHEYCYARQELSVAQLTGSTCLKLCLDATPGMNIQLVILFLDAQKQRISHVMQPANRNLTCDVPPEAAWIRLAIRTYGGGSTTIRALVLGHRDCQPSTLLAKAGHLLLTNHYPAYDDLYRNGFVHTRVAAYQTHGLAVDVFRLRQNEPVSYQEFENVDVMTGSQSALTNMLGAGMYKSILVHALNPQMWDVLRLSTLPIIVWVHGAEIQPWWRRAHNYGSEECRQLGKLESERRMGFWRTLLNPMPANLQLVFVSHHFAEEVMEDLGFRLPPRQYRIIHNPINTRLFSYQEKPLGQRKKILSIRPYASRTYANDLSVKAIQLLAQKPWFNELEFRLVGDGPLFEETLAPLRQYPNVRIEKGYLKQSDIAELHKHYGVFLCPSRMDTQGVSRDEAMASGLVPITSRVGAIAEFVDDDSGFLAEPESFTQLSEAIESLFLNPCLFREKSLNARQRVVMQSDTLQISKAELNLIRDCNDDRERIDTPVNPALDTHLVHGIGS
ncbi:glycosyltransferase family protein [Pseudomonas fluorescens]|nr:glycosyltransferase [Pseudomonas fluorescens]